MSDNSNHTYKQIFLGFFFFLFQYLGTFDSTKIPSHRLEPKSQILKQNSSMSLIVTNETMGLLKNLYLNWNLILHPIELQRV